MCEHFTSGSLVARLLFLRELRPPQRTSRNFTTGTGYLLIVCQLCPVSQSHLLILKGAYGIIRREILPSQSNHGKFTGLVAMLLPMLNR